MATGTQPDAGQILNSLINSILLIDDNLAIHYANPAAQQLLAQSSRKLFGTPLPELLSYFSLNIELMQESLEAGQGFTDNEVTLVIDGRSHILSVTAQRMPDGMILLEMAPMDNQRRLSQEQLQHAQQVAARDLVRGLAHEIKNPLGGLRGAAQLLSKALPVTTRIYQSDYRTGGPAAKSGRPSVGAAAARYAYYRKYSQSG